MTRPSHEELIERFRGRLYNGEPRIFQGDVYPIDDYVLLLNNLGYDATYENLYDEYGFLAQVTINEVTHAIWQGGFLRTEQSVLAVQRSLTSFERRNDSDM
ncbi:hypothetical protein [Halobacterium sp. R2-5]|uniref:hypothetical protein n=1 Tax=Halobacterium sp. R2-5 TaxID=2715751 RepID=UPI001421EE90|nr:hypothetical protein [Halobacterium sp. R2-5]NIC01031.1 hypothetical protein [Halobacterium sp. R2-5]